MTPELLMMQLKDDLVFDVDSLGICSLLRRDPLPDVHEERRPADA